MKTGIAFSKTQFCTDTSKYAPLFKIARYSGRDFWEVARFVVRIMEMSDASYKQDEIYIASALVNGKAHIYMKNINGTNNLDYFVTENGNYYAFYVKATTRNSQVVAHIEYSNNIGFLQATPYEYFDKTRPSSYIAVDGQSHSGGTGGSPTPDPSPDIPSDPSLVHPTITLVQSDAWLNGAGEIFDDNGKNQYDVVKFTAVENTTYSYNYGNCINPAGSVIVFKNSWNNTESIQKGDIPTNGQFTTPANCVEVIMSIKHGTKDKLNMHIGTDIVKPDPEPGQNPDTPGQNPDTPNYPTITMVQRDAWLNGAGEVFDDNGKNKYDVVKFTAVANTTYSYNYGNCINPGGSVIVFKNSWGNTSSIQKGDIPTNGQFTTPENCVEVIMSIKYGTKDKLKMHIGTDVVTPDPEEPVTPPVKPNPDPSPTPTYPTITMVQRDAWLDGAGQITADNGKNQYDIVKFTAVGDTTYSYNYTNCINPAGSVIVFKLANGNTSSLQKQNIPSTGLLTTPADCIEVVMSIKYGTKDKLKMHIGTDPVTPDPEEPVTPPVKPPVNPDPTPDTPVRPAITLVQSDAWLDGTGAVFDDNGKNEYDVVKFTATGNTDYSYNYRDCINRTGSVIVFKLSNDNTDSLQKGNIPNNGVFHTPADCVEVIMSIKYGTKDSLNMRTGSYPSEPPEEPDTPPTPTPDPTPTNPTITLVQSDAWLNGAGEVFDDGGKNELDVVKFTAVQNKTYSYNYADCIDATKSVIVFKLSYGNTSSLQKAEIPTNGQFTTPQDCVEVMMCIKHGSKDSLNVHTVV